LAEVLLSK